MKRFVLMTLILLAPCSSWAAQHSADWCADAVDFSMRTAMYHGLGQKHDEMSGALRKQAVVFKQQYPALSTPDMQTLLDRAFKEKWTHFSAALAVSRDYCSSHAKHLKQVDYLAAGHTDEWCADAVDYSMVTAENRNFGYTAEMLNKSVSEKVYFYHTMFPELSTDDLLHLNGSIYASHWSRFDAAYVISSSCRVSGSNRPSPL